MDVVRGDLLTSFVLLAMALCCLQLMARVLHPALGCCRLCGSWFSSWSLEQLAVPPAAWQAAAAVGRNMDFELWSLFAHVTGCGGLW